MAFAANDPAMRANTVDALKEHGYEVAAYVGRVRADNLPTGGDVIVSARFRLA